jgi:hypothetical protein
MSDQRPVVFIGSSREGLPIAEALQLNLDHSADVQPWSQGVFGLTEGSLESLVKRLDDFDFAILVLTPDDVVISREQASPSARDNVLLELGLFLGRLGRERCFIVYDRSSSIKLPSDLAGVTAATFQPHSSGNLQPALGAASTQIKGVIQKLGKLPSRDGSVPIDSQTHFQVITDLLEPGVHQFLILMHENGIGLRKEEGPMQGPHYEYAIPDKSFGTGSINVNQMCSKLPDAGLLIPDLRNNITLSVRGHAFAEWLVKSGHKAMYFHSTLGGWGDSSLMGAGRLNGNPLLKRPAPQSASAHASTNPLAKDDSKT